MKGILGDIFDFNRDGELDIYEHVAELEYLDESTIETDEDDDDNDFEDFDDFDDFDY